MASSLVAKRHFRYTSSFKHLITSPRLFVAVIKNEVMLPGHPLVVVTGI